jgi:hypothetical protein
MAAISVAKDGKLPFVGVANPVFVLSQPVNWDAGGLITFEVLEIDGETLKSLVGQHLYYAIGDQSFSGVLQLLEPCESTHSGLALLRHKRTFRGSIAVLPPIAGTH